MSKSDNNIISVNFDKLNQKYVFFFQFKTINLGLSAKQ